jgi:alkanesulfonate monooxygenase SsuD/methylene tetrahydromethanopterin reductase-like flavin-dependent oxidoreductase (luciferase family)
MKVGVGLPSVIAGRDPALLSEWARRAERLSFSSLAAHDRLNWDGYEAMITLAAAAGATRSIRLAALAIIAPLRNAALLAKQASSLHAVSGGRLTLALGIGPRRDDYERAGLSFSARAGHLDEILVELRDQWDGLLGPKPELLMAGLSDSTFRRMARHADGYVHGGGPPRAFAAAADRARVAWRDLGRPGSPRLVGTGYFALGDAAERGVDQVRDYYAFVGAFSERIAAGVLTDSGAVLEHVRGYREAGCDELVLFPTVAELPQLELLAKALGTAARR